MSPPDGVVTIPVPVQAQKDQIGLREIQGKGSVGDHVDDEKAHALCLDHQVPEGDVPSLHKKVSPPQKKEDDGSHGVKLFHLPADLGVRIEDRGDIVDRAVLTVQVAPVRHDDGAKNGSLFLKRIVFKPKAAMGEEGGNLHGGTSFLLRRDFHFNHCIISALLVP